MSKWIKIFDYLFLVRPVLFYPIWTVFFAGYLATKRQTSAPFYQQWQQIQVDFVQADFWYSFIVVTLLMGAVFIINQFTDVRTDRENNKLFLIAHGLVSFKFALMETVVLILVAFILAGLFLPRLLLLLFLLFLVTGVAYSLPPLFCKDRPFAGLLVNLLGGFLTFLLGWHVFAKITLPVIWQATPYILAIGSVYFLTTIPDRKGDIEAGKVTFAVRFGERATVIAAVITEILCVFTASLRGDWVILLPALLTFYLFMRLLWRPDADAIIQATRLPILFLSIAVAIFIPFYFLLMLAIYLLSRWYYRQRFHLRYPSFAQIQEES